MGWLSMTRTGMGEHSTPKAYLDAQFNYTKDADGGGTRGARVINSACVGNRVWYAAVEILENGVPTSVTAIICDVRWTPNAKDGYIFAYKDMGENAGPCSDDCPEKVLRLLPPTSNEYALNWRIRCLARLRRRARRVEDGMRIRLPHPLTFSDNHVGSEFVVVKRGSRITFRGENGFGHYHIRNFRDLPWIVVPQTKIHATIFAKPSSAAMTA